MFQGMNQAVKQPHRQKPYKELGGIIQKYDHITKMKKQCHINYMKKTHNCTPPNFYIMLERKRESQNGKTPIKAHNKHCEMQGVHLSFSVIIIHQCFYNFILLQVQRYAFGYSISCQTNQSLSSKLFQLGSSPLSSIFCDHRFSFIF